MVTDFVSGVAQTFTAHNIELPDGTQTLPGEALLENSTRCQAALEILASILGKRAAPPLVADLGCLEGGYSVAFARAGYDVTGYEARTENILCCRYVASSLMLPGLKFEQDDVRSVLGRASEDTWHAVYCGGLLYHLEYPVAFLRDLGRATRRVLVVETHFSDHPDAVHEDHEGHWYQENLASRWAAVRNERSFWLTEDALMQAMREAGFGKVFRHPYGEPPGDRGMFVGIKA